MSNSIIERDGFTWEIQDDSVDGASMFFLSLKDEDCKDEYINNMFFEDIENAEEFIKKTTKRLKIVRVLRTFTCEMENYSYYGSNPGIPEDSYDDVADKINELLNI